MSEVNNGDKRHYIADESLGGIEREYVETDRKADVGYYIIIVKADMSNGEYENGDILKAKSRYSYAFQGGYAGVFVDGIESGIRDYEYTTLSPTNIVRISGERYEMVDRRAEVGEKVIVTNDAFPDDDWKGYENGDAFTAEGIEYDSHHDGVLALKGTDIRLYHSEYSVLSRISDEPVIDPKHGATPKSIEDMLASLSQEVAQLKRKVSELSDDTDRNAKDIRTWADDYTQNKAEVADLTEMLTDDVVLLDERTQPLTTEGVSKLSEELTEVVTEAIDEYLTRKGIR